MENDTLFLNCTSSVINHHFLIAGAPLIQKCVASGLKDHKLLVLQKAMRATLS